MGPQGNMGSVLGREQRRWVGYLPAGNRKEIHTEHLEAVMERCWLRQSISSVHQGRDKKMSTAHM